MPQQSEQTYITYTQNISYIFHDFSSFGFVALVVLCVLYVHSSEINCLCLMKWPSETLQNLPYISGITKTHTLYGFRIPKVCANIDISKSRNFLFLMSVCICVIYFVRPKEEARKWKQQNFLPLMVLGGAKGVTKCCPNLHVMTGQFWVKKNWLFSQSPTMTSLW